MAISTDCKDRVSSKTAAFIALVCRLTHRNNSLHAGNQLSFVDPYFFKLKQKKAP